MFRTLFPLGGLLRQTVTAKAPLEWKSVFNLVGVYKKLSKFKLSSFVVFSTATGFVVSSKEIDWQKLGVTCVGTFGASASANTLNQIYEIKKDALMSRTRLRPLPLGRITQLHALGFALVTGIGGVTLLSHYTNDTAAALAASNIVLYSCVYTPLKQLTYWNTWIGAVVGAIPPVIGWTAASGSIEPGAGVLFSALYFWQIPHFLSLAWTYKADYANAGYRMLSRFDPTGRRVASSAFRNCIYLLPLGLISTQLSMTSPWFAYESFLLTLFYALSASAFYQKPSRQLSRSLFRGSILYLPLWLFAMLLHRQPNQEHVTWSQLKDCLSMRPVYPKRSTLGPETASQKQSPLFAPFPFAPLPMAEPPSAFLWEGLDDIIQELDKSKNALL